MASILSSNDRPMSGGFPEEESPQEEAGALLDSGPASVLSPDTKSAPVTLRREVEDVGPILPHKIPLKKRRGSSLDKLFFPHFRKRKVDLEDLVLKGSVDVSGTFMNYFIQTRQPVEDPLSFNNALDAYETMLSKEVLKYMSGVELDSDTLVEIRNQIVKAVPDDRL